MNKKQSSIMKLTPHPISVNDLKKNLMKNGSLKITGLGIFKLKRTKGRKNAMNPHTKKRQNFAPNTKVSFTPSKELKTKVQKWR